MKVWNLFDIANLYDLAITVSLLNKKFPSSFFDIMSNLLLHVVNELDVCGPIHNKWMYLLDAPQNSLIDSNASPKMKTTEKGVGVHFFIGNILGVEG